MKPIPRRKRHIPPPDAQDADGASLRLHEYLVRREVYVGYGGNSFGFRRPNARQHRRYKHWNNEGWRVLKKWDTWKRRTLSWKKSAARKEVFREACAYAAYRAQIKNEPPLGG